MTTFAGDDACAAIARTDGAPLAGTAPHVRGWVVVEVDGPWSPTTHDNLPPEVHDRWAAATDGRGVRLQLMRAPGPHPRSSGGRRVLLAHSGPTPWMRLLTDVADDALAELPVAACADPVAPDLGTPVESPWMLVCTHGARDRCCARFGRPVVDALTPVATDVVETSHVGGHRYAGNVLVLPDGLLFGSLDAATAAPWARMLAAGQLPTTRLRGRTWLEPGAQAAEIAARRAWGDDDATAPLQVLDHDDGTFTVTLGTRKATVTLARRTRPPAVLSCGDEPSVTDEFVVVDVRGVQGD